MAANSRVYTHFIKPFKSLQLAEFSQCLIKTLSPEKAKAGDEIQTFVELIDHKLVVQHHYEGIPFRHFERCPIKFISEVQRQSLPEDVVERNVGAAVSILLESNDGMVLVTRRSSTMRTFPNVWVPPGGKIDKEDDSLLDAGLRELKEETGLDFNQCNLQKSQPICMWESVFPTSLEDGEPRRHDVVVYLHVRVNQSSQELQGKLIMEPMEVDACMWLDTKLVELAVTSKNDIKVEEFVIYKLNPDYSCEMVKKSTDLLRKRYGDQKHHERLSSGTIFALQNWLKLQ